ncbi:hypothetical protein BD779DRAFT_1554828 [Infundibulicybe gibba]|nr:hypothetical protein BD779DRAFT_1554828 [Infundibulicybe gibba]
MSDTNAIIFYDIPSMIPGNAWSPNTWKTRFSLNYKSLAYKTEWVEYPDIEPLCKKIGAPPTSTKATGEPHYTLPVIFDPKTKRAISDSAAIAEYLDEQYPETPKLFPTVREFALPQTCVRLRPESQPYFRSTREKMFGMKIEALTPTGAALPRWVAHNPGGGVFVTGDTPVFVDFMVAGQLVWIKVLWEDEVVGAAGKLFAAVEKYAAVDNSGESGIWTDVI